MHSPKGDNLRSYAKPLLRKLTSDQATLFLLGHAYIGNQGAKVLLEWLFPEPPMRLGRPLN
jgi:hypothetical protein